MLCARPLHYHSFGDHLYWKKPAAASNRLKVVPRVVSLEPAGKGAIKIRYTWDVQEDLGADWRVFVHFGRGEKILFQDDHAPDRPTSKWRKGQTIEIGPHTVSIPPSVKDKSVNVYIGLFSTTDVARRAALPGCDSRSRVLVGRLDLKPEIRFAPSAPAAAGPDRGRYVRSDNGWAAGLHPTDAFLKNTHEVLGPLHAATAHQLLTRLEFLTPDRTVRRAVYGSDRNATTVVVNFGHTDAKVTSKLGGQVSLPPWGFVIDAPRFAAFSANSWGGQKYPRGALFTLRATDNKPLAESARVRIFHAFGESTIPWRGRTHKVPREKTITTTP